MKKITLILTYILFSCDNSSLEQKKKRVDELKNSLVEIYTEIDNLEKEISEFDSTFNNKNYELVSIISPYSGTFSHEISLRGNIQSNMNILIVPGDGKDTFNISTISSFVVAGSGIKVAKHGNYGVSSSCGSSNIISHLGHEFSNDVSSLKYSLDKSNICLMHAP